MNLCTYFDERYLPRALVLYESLRRFCPAFTLYALCLDDAAFEHLQARELEHLIPVRLSDLERAMPELVACKGERSLVEYYWTCGPAFLLHVLSKNPTIEQISYIDADTMFFSSPEPLLREIEPYSVSIVAHGFPESYRFREKFGKFNVGWLTFRRDAEGLKALRWWHERCIEWCFDRVEGDKFADQRYLDKFPELFKGVHVIEHKGVNVGPWSVGNYPVTEKDGAVFVGGEPLIFFHFHGFKQLQRWLFDTNLGLWGKRTPRTVRQGIYGRYIQAISRHTTDKRSRSRRVLDYTLPAPLRIAKMLRRVVFGTLNMSYLVVLRGRVL